MTPPEDHDDDDSHHYPHRIRRWGPQSRYVEFQKEQKQEEPLTSPPVPVTARMMTRIMQLRYHGQTQDLGRPLANPPLEWRTAYCQGEGRGVVNLVSRGGFHLKDVFLVGAMMVNFGIGFGTRTIFHKCLGRTLPKLSIYLKRAQRHFKSAKNCSKQ